MNRLRWMRDVLGPTLGRAIRSLEQGLPVNSMIAKAVAMGDEFHQRNIAASLVFLKELAPIITGLDMEEKERYDVIKFLSDTDQFFLNIMMATGKAVMGDQWFTGPVNTPKGLYFIGYDSEDACPDMRMPSVQAPR